MEIRELSSNERAALSDGLAMAARFADSTQPLSTEQVQDIYDTLLKDHPTYAEGVIAAGLAFGELIATKAGYEWVRVVDGHGEETALSPIGIRIICSPISMIQKRIARGETLDIAALRDETIRIVQARIDSGEYESR